MGNNSNTPWIPSTVKEMRADDICKIIECARKASLSEFSYGELSFKLGEVPPTIQEVADNLARRQADFKQAKEELKQTQIDELALTDAGAYEELIEKRLLGNPSEILSEAP